MKIPDFKQIVKFGKAFYKRLGEETVKKHVNYIRSGKDVEGKDYLIYSKSYARKKKVSRNNVNLTATGNMLKNIKLHPVSDSMLNLRAARGFKYSLRGRKNIQKMNAHISGDYGHPYKKPRVTTSKETPIPDPIQKYIALEIAKKIATKLDKIVVGHIVIRI